MKSVLVGNGIDIQFGGKAYSNDFIMRRIIFNARANRYDLLFNNKVSGNEIYVIFKEFVNIANHVRLGDYDGITEPDVQDAIKDFKGRYSAPIKEYYEIMLEDWFLLIYLYFLLNADLKDLWISAKQGFERMILDAIYNEGKLAEVHQNMNKKVRRFFADFDYVFSLNYDCNLENLTRRDVMHLHGDYSVLADSENPATIQGFIRSETGETVVIEEFRHCFCNALLDYSGELKYRRASAINKGAIEFDRWLALSRDEKAEYDKQIEYLKKRNEDAFRFVSTYVQNPFLSLGTDYHFKALTDLDGELHIIGLSPNNDGHIFKCINESTVEKVVFVIIIIPSSVFMFNKEIDNDTVV